MTALLLVLGRTGQDDGRPKRHHDSDSGMDTCAGRPCWDHDFFAELTAPVHDGN